MLRYQRVWSLSSGPAPGASHGLAFKGVWPLNILFFKICTYTIFSVICRNDPVNQPRAIGATDSWQLLLTHRSLIIICRQIDRARPVDRIIYFTGLSWTHRSTMQSLLCYCKSCSLCCLVTWCMLIRGSLELVMTEHTFTWADMNAGWLTTVGVVLFCTMGLFESVGLCSVSSLSSLNEGSQTQ